MAENTTRRGSGGEGENQQPPPSPVNPPVADNEDARMLRAAAMAEADARADAARHAERVQANAGAPRGALADDEDGPPLPRGVRAADLPAVLPRGFYKEATGYIVEEYNILASTNGLATTSYTLRAADVAADANGDKLVRVGTTIAPSTAAGFGKPRAVGEGCIGVLMYTVNLREGDQPVALIRAGRLRRDKMTDEGTFGTVSATAATALAALGIYLTTFDGG